MRAPYITESTRRLLDALSNAGLPLALSSRTARAPRLAANDPHCERSHTETRRVREENHHRALLSGLDRNSVHVPSGATPAPSVRRVPLMKRGARGPARILRGIVSADDRTSRGVATGDASPEEETTHERSQGTSERAPYARPQLRARGDRAPRSSGLRQQRSPRSRAGRREAGAFHRGHREKPGDVHAFARMRRAPKRAQTRAELRAFRRPSRGSRRLCGQGSPSPPMHHPLRRPAP